MFLLSCRSSVNTFDLKNEVFCCVKSLNSGEHINLTGCSPIIWLECTVYPDPILVFFFFLPPLRPQPDFLFGLLNKAAVTAPWIQLTAKGWRVRAAWQIAGKPCSDSTLKQSLHDLSHRHSHFLPTTFTSCWAPCRKWRKNWKKKKKSTAASGTEMWNCNVTSKRRGKISQRNHTNYNHYRCGKVQ